MNIGQLQVPRTFPMFLEPFGDDSLSMAALGVLSTIRAHRAFNSDVDDSFYEAHKGAVQELIKKGYIFEHREFGDDINDPEVDNPLLREISSTPYFMSDELSSKEYSKVLNDAMGVSWKSSGFCVHHINHNRKDNSVENLLLLPVKLHRKYHLLEQQTRKLRDEFAFEGIVKDIAFHKKTLFAFIYTMADMEEMKKVQDNIIKTKEYCATNGKEFDGRDMFIAGNREILQKYQ